MELTKENLDKVGKHFKGFMDEVGEHILEREDFLNQLMIALLAREHTAIIGHKGAAKTTVANLVFQRIVDAATGEPSFFSKLCYPEMRHAEVVGPQIPVTDPNTGKVTFQRQFDDGIADFDFALFDEGFDAPGSVLKGALNSILNEREIMDGATTRPISLKTAVLASNKTMEQLRKIYGNDLEPLLDRFGSLFWTPKRSIKPGVTDQKIAEKAAERKVKSTKANGKQELNTPPLLLQEIELLSQAVTRVRERMLVDQWPIKVGKDLYNRYHRLLDDRKEDLGDGMGPSMTESKRTMNRLITNILPAVAVARHIAKPDTPLAILPEDFEKFRLFLMMRSPVTGPDLAAFDPSTMGDKQDEAILSRQKVEDETFTRAYNEIVVPVQADLGRRAPRDLARIRDEVTRRESDLPDYATKNFPWISTRLDNLQTNLSDIEGFAFQVAEGELLYVRALVAYITWAFYAIGVATNESDAAIIKNKFQTVVRPHIRKLSNSLYRGQIEHNVARFTEAVKANHAKRNRQNTAQCIGHLDEIAADAEVLGADTVAGLRDAVRQACLGLVFGPDFEARITTAASLQEKLDELFALLKFARGLAQEGIGREIPLERMAELRTQTLKIFADLAEQAQKEID
ncbi:hypothetical protein HYV58_01600, partial [Candidatus Peregrinibacteria bacterium]|nr:hypothetical protein [Candidatus Peregrinibacteria bacterium]